MEPAAAAHALASGAGVFFLCAAAPAPDASMRTWIWCISMGSGCTPPWPASASRGGPDKPHLISPHGMLDPWALHNSNWKKRLAATFFENANLKSAACIHALNAAEAEASAITVSPAPYA